MHIGHGTRDSSSGLTLPHDLQIYMQFVNRVAVQWRSIVDYNILQPRLSACIIICHCVVIGMTGLFYHMAHMSA